MLRNPPRMPALRETALPRHCETEPLLPLTNNVAKIVPTQRYNNLPPPPLPPHYMPNIHGTHTYTPPWPRGGTPPANINSKPYNKPLPRIPVKEVSPGRLRKTPPAGVPPPLPPHRYGKTEEAGGRGKTRNSHNNPLLNLQRHYSDESLQGAAGFYHPVPPAHRIHSSADEISSLNHSPSISSSDESYSRTTDASPSPSPPLHKTGKTSPHTYLYPSDIQVDPSSSLENSPRTSMDYIPPQCLINNNSFGKNSGTAEGKSISSSRSFSPGQKSRGNSSGGRRDWSLSPGRHSNGRRVKNSVATNTESIPPNALLALAAGSNTMESRCSPLPGEGVDYRGDSCGSFEYIGGKRPQKGTNLLRAASANGERRSPKMAKKVLATRESPDENVTRDEESAVKNGSSQSKGRHHSGSKSDLGNVADNKRLPSPGAHSAGAASKYHHQAKVLPNFEREIQKLLEDQNLLKNIPPKSDKTHQNKEIISLEEIKNVNDVLEELGQSSIREPVVIARYVGSNNNSSGNPPQQIGLACIQELAKKQHDLLNNLIEPDGKAYEMEGKMEEIHRKASNASSNKFPLSPVTVGVRADDEGAYRSFRSAAAKEGSEYENLESDEVLEDEEEDEEKKENAEIESFEQEEQRIAEEVERQPEDEDELELEAEVKRILEESGNVADENVFGELSQSEWSDDDAASEPLLAGDRESTGYTTDDPALENISMLNETGLTDAEGALSDVNSVCNDGCHGDGDDTSLSSRASSRIFDSDAMMSLDSLSVLYDSEYDNCYRTDDDVAAPELDRIDYFTAVTTDTNLANIRSVSESITRNFGQPASETELDSDV